MTDQYFGTFLSSYIFCKCKHFHKDIHDSMRNQPGHITLTVVSLSLPKKKEILLDTLQLSNSLFHQSEKTGFSWKSSERVVDVTKICALSSALLNAVWRFLQGVDSEWQVLQSDPSSDTYQMFNLEPGKEPQLPCYATKFDKTPKKGFELIFLVFFLCKHLAHRLEQHCALRFCALQTKVTNSP